MADARVATGTALNTALADAGILYDGSAEGFVDTMNHSQIKELIRIVESQGCQLSLAAGVLNVKQAAGMGLTDTSAA